MQPLWPRQLLIPRCRVDYGVSRVPPASSRPLIPAETDPWAVRRDTSASWRSQSSRTSAVGPPPRLFSGSPLPLLSAASSPPGPCECSQTPQVMLAMLLSTLFLPILLCPSHFYSISLQTSLSGYKPINKHFWGIIFNMFLNHMQEYICKCKIYEI